jgi:GNAT superfamily N-acetyltransferase
MIGLGIARSRARDFRRGPTGLRSRGTAARERILSNFYRDGPTRCAPEPEAETGVPEQVPLLLIGRLAIDASYQGKGVGTALVSDALQRCLAAADIVCARGVVAHAIDDDALSFCRRRGFLSRSSRRRALLT